MKGKIAMLRRSGLSLLLVICLMVGMCSPAFAAKNEKHAMLDEAVAELIDLIAEYEGDLYKYAYDWAEGEGYIDDALAYIDEIIATLETEGEAAKAELEELKAQVADAEQQIADAEEQIEDYDNQVADAEQEIADAEQQIADAEQELADAKAELEGYKQDLETAKAELEQAKQDLEDAKADLIGGVPGAADEVAKAEDEIDKAEADIAQAEADIDSADTEIANAEQDLADAKAELEGYKQDLADAKAELADAKVQLADAKAQLADAKAQLADAELAFDELIAEIKETLNEAKAVILEADVLDQATVDALKALFDEAEQDMAKIDEIMQIATDAGIDPAELGALVDLHDAYVVLTEELIPLMENDIIPAVLDAQDYVKAQLEAAMAELGVTYDDAAQKIPQLVYDATHGEYEVTNESHYVALGGATASGLGFRGGKTYSELFAAHLGLEDTYKDLTDDQLDVTGTVQYIKDNAVEIAKADIITYQMDAYMFLLTAMDGTVDWSNYVKDADLLAQVEDAKAALVDELSKEYDAQTVADIVEQVERVLYAFVAYGFENAKAVQEIKAINGDAVIVMLGMYNPLQGLTVDVDGTIVDVSNMCANLMIASDVNNLIFAMTSGGVVFVEISQAEAKGFAPIVLDTSDVDAAMGQVADILDNMNSMCANANGHEYIYQQILDALEITKKEPSDTSDRTNIGMWTTVTVLCAAAFVGLIGSNKAKGWAK